MTGDSVMAAPSWGDNNGMGLHQRYMRLVPDHECDVAPQARHRAAKAQPRAILPRSLRPAAIHVSCSAFLYNCATEVEAADGPAAAVPGLTKLRGVDDTRHR